MARPAGSVIALYAGLLLVVVLALPSLRRSSSDRARVRATVALASLGTLPLVAVAALIAEREPFIRSHWVCGTGIVPVLLFGVPLAAVILLTPVSAAAHVVVTLGRQLTRAVVKIAAMLALAVAVLTTEPALRAPGEPSHKAWLAELEVVAELEAPAASETRAVELDDGTSVHVECDAQGSTTDAWCDAHLCRPSAPGASEVCGEPSDVGFLAGSFVVRRDARHGFLVVESEAGDSVAFDSALRLTDVSRADIDDVLASPLPFAVLARFGVTGSFLAFLAGLFAARRRRALDRGRDGISDGASVTFVDGALPSRGVLAEPCAIGPVVAQARVSQLPPTYRDDGARGEWYATAGTRAEQRDAIDLGVLSWDATALAFALLGTLPLFI